MLNVRTEAATGGETVVHVVGEVDMATADTLADRIRDALAGSGGAALVVDLAGVSFLDSTGIRVLVEAHRGAGEAGVALLVRRPREPVERVLRVTGVATILGLPPE